MPPGRAVVSESLPVGNYTTLVTVDGVNNESSGQYLNCQLHAIDSVTNTSTNGLENSVLLPDTNPAGLGTLTLTGTFDAQHQTLLSVRCYGGTTKQSVQGVVLVATAVGAIH